VNVNLAHGAYDRLVVYMYVNAFIVVVVVVVVVSPHRMHRVQRFGILLPTFHSLCVCVSVSLFFAAVSCAKTAELIEMPFEM